MNKVNSIVICRDEYKSKEEFENAIKDRAYISKSDEETVFTVDEQEEEE